MTTDREAAEWVERTYRAESHPTVAAMAVAYLRALDLVERGTDVGHERWLVRPVQVRAALSLTMRSCGGCGCGLPNDVARCSLCGHPYGTEVLT